MNLFFPWERIECPCWSFTETTETLLLKSKSKSKFIYTAQFIQKKLTKLLYKTSDKKITSNMEKRRVEIKTDNSPKVHGTNDRLLKASKSRFSAVT